MEENATTNPATQKALEACYSAIVEPSIWGNALQQVAESLGARSCVVRRDDFNVREMDLIPFDSIEHAGFTELWMDRIEGAPDPHCGRPQRLRREGHVAIIEHQITTDQERSEMPYYQEIAAPGDRPWWAMVAFETASHSWCLPVFRTDEAGPFSPRDAADLAALSPFLRPLFSLAETFAETSLQAGLAAFDTLARPVVLLDWKGQITRLNDAARRLIGSGLVLNRGRLDAVDSWSSERLQNFIGEVLSEPPSAARRVGPALLAREGLPWLLVEAVPTTSVTSDVFVSSHSLLIFNDLTDARVPDETLLRSVFGLTPAEARVAKQIASGQGVLRAAEALGVGRETARSQLRAVFAKTGTYGQAELAALLTRIQARRQ